MNSETPVVEEAIWNDDVEAENDALIEAIENDIASTRAQLHRLSETDDEDDILFM